jgi:integrase
VPRNAAEAVDPPRPDKKERPTLTLEETRLFLKTAKRDRFYALYVLAIHTGMRRGELLGLKWGDVDLDRGVLQIKRALTPRGKSFNQPKSAKGRRRIGLTPESVEALKRHRVAQNEERLRRGRLWQDHGLVFPSQVGTPMHPDNFVKRSFKPLLERAGLPRLAFHDLRHTFASLMLLNREHPKVVQEMIGHSQISTTLDTYSHVLPDMQEEAVKRFGSLFS